MFELGINYIEGLADGLFQRSFPSMTPALAALMFGYWG